MTTEISRVTCNICAKDKKSFLIVSCPKCGFESCKMCIQKFLLGLNDVIPRCMSCKFNWSYDFISSITPPEFHNKEYREHRAKIVMERERALLPATQPVVVIEMKKKDSKEQVKKINAKILKYTKKIEALRKTKNELKMGSELQVNVDKIPKDIFIGRCPADDCKGFLEKKNIEGKKKYICGLCQTEACKKCRAVKHKGSDCNPELLETVKLLQKDTKPCPNCKVLIYKTEGCDQMFCVSCNTAFSWVTGKVEKGRVHNPHYFEWLRNSGGNVRDARDIPCGGIDNRMFSDFLRFEKNEQIVFLVEDAHRLSGELRDKCTNMQHILGINKYQDLRVKYLMNELEEKDWLRVIKMREKRREKLEAIYQVYSMFSNACDDIVRSLITKWNEHKKNRNLTMESEDVVQLMKLREYTNIQLTKISTLFDNKVKLITDTFRIVEKFRFRNRDELGLD